LHKTDNEDSGKRDGCSGNIDGYSLVSTSFCAPTQQQQDRHQLEESYGPRLNRSVRQSGEDDHRDQAASDCLIESFTQHRRHKEKLAGA
jgi:hypothetical protein